MPQIKVKNVSQSTLLNRQPGAEFTLNVDADGVPVGNLDHKGRNADIFWRQRMDEDKKFNGDTPALQITPVPVTHPAPPPVASVVVPPSSSPPPPSVASPVATVATSAPTPSDKE